MAKLCTISKFQISAINIYKNNKIWMEPIETKAKTRIYKTLTYISDIKFYMIWTQLHHIVTC